MALNKEKKILKHMYLSINIVDNIMGRAAEKVGSGSMLFADIDVG